MKGKKKIVSLLLATTLCFGMAAQVEAAGIDEAKRRQKNLKIRRKQRRQKKNL